MFSVNVAKRFWAAFLQSTSGSCHWSNIMMNQSRKDQFSATLAKLLSQAKYVYQYNRIILIKSSNVWKTYHRYYHCIIIVTYNRYRQWIVEKRNKKWCKEEYVFMKKICRKKRNRKWFLLLKKWFLFVFFWN